MSAVVYDVDKFRTEFECDEHWELRRKFLIAHHDKFCEDELVCLAQTFTNIEFLGCRYPQETMKKVASLAQGIVDEYREKQKGRLKRTFVAASDAAGAKVKGFKQAKTDTTPSPISKNQPKFLAAQRLPEFVDLTNDTSPEKPRVLYGPPIRNVVSEKTEHQISRYGGMYTHHKGFKPELCNMELKENKYGKLLIIEMDTMSPNHIIMRSMNTCNVKFSYETESVSGHMVRAKLIVNDILVAQCEDFSAKFAKDAVARLGLQKLKESCYTIKVKHKFLSDTTVDKTFTSGPANEQGPRTEMADMDTPLADSNVGSKLLRMMGWSGGGLGRDAQGIAEPISVKQETVRRSGLGLGQGAGSFNVAEFRAQARGLLRDYARRDTTHDLVFTSEFTSDERKELHMLAHQLQLKTKSHGGKREENRFLVVSKKVSFWDEAKKLLRSGGSSERYELIPPHITI